ncbi:MAG: heparinase II/III family protein, partial [Candidatus Latescibacteria bacterium]|nr:heparinase II/III family protein [Candidatus Latescibacterota bacterium]
AAAEVDDAELIRIIHRLHEETAYLRHDIGRWVGRRSNAACALILSMAAACVVLEDFAAVDEWLEHDARLLARYIDEAFYPDGQCIEQTTAYSSSVAFQVQNTACALREQKGIRSALDKLRAMVTWAVAMSKPSGWMPSFGDHFADKLSGAVYEPMLEWVDHPWAGGFFSGEGVPPFTVWPEPGQDVWCGYHSMRSDWGPDARYMVVDCGPWGTTHRHGDRLSFVLSAFGADFIIDPTATRYASNAPDAFLSRQEASFLHNTVTVDGVDEFINTPNETGEPLDNRWEHGEGWSLFVGSYSFAPVRPVVWERRILFVDRAYWLLQDVIRGDLVSAELEQNLQFQEDIEVAVGQDPVLAAAPNGARLAMLQLSGGLTPALSTGGLTPRTTYWPDGKPHQTRIAEDGERPPSHGRGWTGRRGHKLLPAPALTYVGRADLPAVLTVAMVPIAPDGSTEDLPRISSRIEDDRTIWVLPCAAGAVRFETSAAGCGVASA